MSLFPRAVPLSMICDKGLPNEWITNIGILVDKDDLINYQLIINLRTFTYQPTVDKTILAINQLLILEGLLMFPDNVCSCSPPVPVCTHLKLQKKIAFSIKKSIFCFFKTKKTSSFFFLNFILKDSLF